LSHRPKEGCVTVQLHDSPTPNRIVIIIKAPIDALQVEIDRLRQDHDKVFQASPIGWIEKKLSEFSELLELNTGKSALALCKLLGLMKLEAQFLDQGKSYYVAHSSVNALALIEPLTGE